MTLDQFFTSVDLERSLWLGYYGGGNFGDELLLEVVMGQLRRAGVQSAWFWCQNMARYADYHHDFGYTPVGPRSVWGALWRSKTVAVGGGGLWGESNPRVVVMGALLVLARLLGKPVYLVGVGYYKTSIWGRLGARLAKLAATEIIVRDAASLERFGAGTLDQDLAFLIPGMSLRPYRQDWPLTFSERMAFVTLRQATWDEQWHTVIDQVVLDNPDISFVVALLQPEGQFLVGVDFIARIANRPNVQVLEVRNPLSLVAMFMENASRFKFVTPQYHAIVVAILAGIPYFPVAYAEKVRELLAPQGVKHPIAPEKVTAEQLNVFLRTEEK